MAIQSVCPADLTEHLGIGIYDNTAYQLALDALTHPGPPTVRVAATTCLSPLMPGINPSTFAADYANTLASVASTVATSPQTTAEPPLACYVTATCPTGRAAPQRRSTRALGTRSVPRGPCARRQSSGAAPTGAAAARCRRRHGLRRGRSLIPGPRAPLSQRGPP